MLREFLNPRGWKPSEDTKFFLDAEQINQLCDVAEQILQGEPSVLRLRGTFALQSGCDLPVAAHRHASWFGTAWGCSLLLHNALPVAKPHEQYSHIRMSPHRLRLQLRNARISYKRVTCAQTTLEIQTHFGQMPWPYFWLFSYLRDDYGQKSCL